MCAVSELQMACVEYGIMDRPVHLDLDRERGLTVQWADGSSGFFPVGFLRRMSPSAEARETAKGIGRKPADRAADVIRDGWPVDR